MNTYHLWESDIPGKMFEEPVLSHYSPEIKKSRAAILIFSGGGYRARAKHEGEGYAELFNEMGLEAFVLSYRVTGDPTIIDTPLFPYPLLDARRAMRYLRQNAEALGIDADKIAVIGSSAGGHLAALLSTYRAPIEGEGVDAMDDIDYLPNAQILCYPVITFDERYTHRGSFQRLLGPDCVDPSPYCPSLIADEKTPPAFLWHTSTDATVNVTNSYLYAARLREVGVPCEMHIFPFGDHGLGRALHLPHVAQWAELLKNYLTWLDFLPSEA